MRSLASRPRLAGGVLGTVLAVLAALLVPPRMASASTLPPTIYVGYADDIRANPGNFPTPWSGSPGAVYIGSAAPWDAGAVMLVNPNSAPLLVDGVNVDLQRPGPTFNPWGSFTIPANGRAILTQTTQYNFDTSESAITACGTRAASTDRPPKVSVTIAGTTSDFLDGGHVLDTGGFDGACLGNESSQWTQIGSAPCPGSRLTATPATQSKLPGATASLALKFTNGCGAPLGGVAISVTIPTGPNAGTTGTVTTNSAGAATYSYSSTAQGIDTVQAAVNNAVGAVSTPPVNVFWQTATLSLNPAAAQPGATVTFPAPSPGTASGYAPSESVALHANSITGPLLSTVTATAGGAIAGSFVVPVPTGTSITSVVAVGASSSKQGWALFNSGCGVDWTNPGGGNFDTAANWSTGVVPGASDLACVVLPGTYTVTSTTSHSLAGLIVGSSSSGSQVLDVAGGNQTLTVNGPAAINAFGNVTMDSPDGNYSILGGTGTLTNNGTLSLPQGYGSTRYLRMNIVNNGTANLADFDIRMDSGNTFTSAGATSVPGGLSITGGSAFTHTTGTLDVPGSVGVNAGTFTQTNGLLTGSPVTLVNSTLNDAAGKGAFVLQCNNTLSGTVPAGQKVTIQGSTCGNATASLPAAGLLNKGTLLLDSTNGNFAMLQGGPLTNNATFQTLQGNGGPRYLRSNITNAPTGKITIANFDTRIDNTTTTVNNGTITITAVGGLTVSGNSVLTRAAGTVTNSGVLSVISATLNQNGGTATGNPITLNNSIMSDTGGTGSFLMQCSNTFSGGIQAGQSVTVQGNPCGNAALTLTGASVTNNGSLLLTSTNGFYALVQGSPVTNNGSITLAQGNGGPRYLRVPLTNAATGTVTVTSFTTNVDGGTTTVNNGTFTVASGGGVNVTSGTFTQAAGSLTNNGVLQVVSSTFNQSGGTGSGNPIVLNGTTLNDSAGTGAFLLQCTNNLGGTIPSGQSVTVQGNACGNAALTLLAPGVTNNGALALDSTNGNYALVQGAALTNNGTFSTLGGTNGTRYIRVPITNAGTMSIHTADTRQDSNTATTSSGTLEVFDGAHDNLTGGSAYTQSAAGQLKVTINAIGGAFGLDGGSSGPVSLAGTLTITTVGSPTVGNAYSVVSNANRTGTFTTVNTGGTNYAISYPAGGVVATRMP